MYLDIQTLFSSKLNCFFFLKILHNKHYNDNSSCVQQRPQRTVCMIDGHWIGSFMTSIQRPMSYLFVRKHTHTHKRCLLCLLLMTWRAAPSLDSLHLHPSNWLFMFFFFFFPVGLHLRQDACNCFAWHHLAWADPFSAITAAEPVDRKWNQDNGSRSVN